MIRGGFIEQGIQRRFDLSKPTLTVITVVKDNCAFIERTIKSVIEQTYCNIEYIIIDGESVDGTLDIIRKYDDYISLWISEPDEGIYDAMNKAIRLASSEWLNFMNSGDIFSSNQIVENVFRSMLVEKVKFIYSDALLQDYSKIEHGPEYWWTSFELKSVLHQCVIYKKELHEEFGKYISHKCFIAADYFFFNLIPIEVVRKYESEAIAIYRIDEGYSTLPTCHRQVQCIDYLFHRITFRELVFDLVKDNFMSKRKRKSVLGILNKMMNKTRSIISILKE